MGFSPNYCKFPWLQQLLSDLSNPPSLPPIIWGDNMSPIALASNPVVHVRTKHIEVDYHFIREKVINKQVSAHHIGSWIKLLISLQNLSPWPGFSI